METLTWLGFGAFFVASSSVGARLLGLWHRGGGVPELLIGIGVLGIGPVGFGSMTIGQLLAADHDLAARAIYAVGLFAASAGALSKFAFNTYVYHPANRLTWAVCALAGLALVGCYLAEGIMTHFQNINGMGVFYVVRTVLTITCLLWGSAEAIRYWLMMRRRARLGLAEPIVTNRFLLWGIGAGAAGLGTLVGVLAQWRTGLAPVEIPWVMLSSSLHGTVAAVAMWLAFLPPERFRRYIAGRAEASGVA